ncbi:MAG TPA: GAF domain-containing protein [Aggregatilineales bacterium]|nr:GAF domain-containing protein [Aggregatilineales bacterium]
MFNRNTLRSILLIGFLLLTSFLLLTNLPELPAATRISSALIDSSTITLYAALTVFTLIFGVYLRDGEVSIAQAVGMVAALALPAEWHTTMLWMLPFAGAIGGLGYMFRTQPGLRRSLNLRTAGAILMIAVRVTLSFYIGIAVLRTELFSNQTGTIANDPIQVIGFGLIYSGAYGAIFLIERFIARYSLRRLLNDRLSMLILAAVLLTPIPFVLLAALVVNLSSVTLLIFGLGVVLVAGGLHVLSRIQHRQRKQVEELRALGVVGRLIQSDLKLSSLLGMLHSQVSELLDVDEFVVALYEPYSGALQYPLVMRGGVQVDDYAEPADGNSLLGHLLQTHVPLLINETVAETAQQLGLKPPAARVRSWLGVPLTVGQKQLGGIVVTTSQQQAALENDDLRLMNIIAASASVAIANARLLEQLSSRAAQLATLNQALSQLTRTLSPAEVTQIIAGAAPAISGASGIAIYLANEEGRGAIKLAHSQGLSSAFSSDPPEPILSYPAGEPVYIDDAQSDPRAVPYRNFITREGKRAWAELPLQVGDSGLGVLALYYDRPQQFTGDQAGVLRAFASQAAQAIQNARRYTRTDRALERRAEQMYALATLGRQLTATTNVQEIGTQVLRRATEMTHAKAGFIAIGEQDDLQIIEQTGYPASVLMDATLVRSTLSAVALQTNQAIRKDDVKADGTRPPPILLTSRAQLSVPILRAGKPLGVITLESDEPAAFSEEDNYFVTQLASQATMALDNTRLFKGINDALERLQVILNTMTEAIVLVEKNGNIALANPRVRMIGLEPDQLVGRKLDRLLATAELGMAARLGFSSGAALNKLLNDLRTPGAWSSQAVESYSLNAEDGTPIYLRREIILVGDRNAPLGALLVFYDETQQRELLQAREDLSNMIVHDLRSPLTAVTTGLRLLVEVVPEGDKLYPIIHTATETGQRAVRKILSRVDSLLDISRLESGTINLDTEATELATLADSVCAELSPLANDLEVTLESKLDETVPLVLIDADKVERLLQNLVDNALKYAPFGSTVSISAQPPVDGFVRINISDQGPGIPDEYKVRLFDRFVQIKGRQGSRRGSGLGLTFCKLVVEAHGGRIWIEDNPGGGSIFAFTLPVIKGEYGNQSVL